jgi:hypothetical protein
MRTSQANLAERDWPPPGSAGDGLLEQSWLRIGPRDGTGQRGIRDRAGRLVGLCQARRLAWWWRWLGTGQAVFEARDEPLVFSVLPSLSLTARLVVRDADGDLVGAAGRHQLHDRWGRLLLIHRASPAGRGGQFEGAAGEVVARWAELAGEITLEMDGAWLVGPFERMLVLTRALVEN